MSFGYFSLPRSLTRNPLWLDLPPAYKEVFMVILDHCVWKPTKFDDHGLIIDLQPAQICISERELLKKCGKYISRNDIQRSIKKFILYQFVSQEVRRKKSIITITHKDTYDLFTKQSDATSEPNLSQTRAKLEPERNKEKKEKNENKKEKINKKEIPEKIAIREWVSLTQDELDSFRSRFLPELAEKMLDILDAYNTSRQKHYASDYGALKTNGWVHTKSQEQSQGNKFNQQDSIRDKLAIRFKHGEIYQGAECYFNGESIAFSRGMTHYQVRFSEKGFWSQFDNILQKMGIVDG